MRRSISLSFVFLLAACGGGVATDPTSSLELTADVEFALRATLQDERHAEAIYSQVLADHGSITPFQNIVRAERQHALAIEGLFRKRGLTVPSVQIPVSDIPRFSTLSDACAASADAEIANIALYDEFMQRELPSDVRTVFTNNRRASLENHLPAFSRCR